ncbi:hypothetical protein Trydic_g13037 [Trypoxylus dichotomus]
MVQLQVKILNKDGKEDVIYCVGKTCPPTEFIWEVFNTKVTFKKEIEVYKTIAPTLNEFGRQYGLDNVMSFFAKCLGARISLDPKSDVVDKDAVLLLENLLVKGYSTGDRFVGFNFDATKFLLGDLATLHAVPLAFRLKKPEEYEMKIRPYLNKDFTFKFSKEMTSDYINSIQKILATVRECVPFLSNVEEAILKLVSMSPENTPNEKELFATFTHNDYWVNNTMIKYEDGKPVSNRIVDFQIIEHHSLAHDVVFFLYSSVELEVLQSHLDELFQYYYDKFIGILKQFDCDIKEFTFEAFMEECGHITRQEQFGHIMIMLPGIMTLKEKAKELSELKEGDIVAQEKSLHENCLKKLRFLLLDLEKRGWM